ncbi:hypothetical protein TCDM_13559 [Trypanosoma cruzi Dm28c]|uniref:Uncharacterized protein n=1 Tax=Trypanosoma cruzi Dm28c TaxID=1416333 RepID=V5ASC9_TRYCR|nr:hypothetical protein TCDM_13559 [Trypanosoma cruzi Dm28c]
MRKGRVQAVREVVVKYRPHTPIAKRHAVLVFHIHNVGGAKLVVAVHQPAAVGHGQRFCNEHGEAKTESAGHNLQHATTIHRNIPKHTRTFVDFDARRNPRAVLYGEHGAATDTQVRRKSVHHMCPRHNDAVVHVEDAGQVHAEAALHEDRSAQVPATHHRRPRHDKPRRQQPDAVQNKRGAVPGFCVARSHRHVLRPANRRAQRRVRQQHTRVQRHRAMQHNRALQRRHIRHVDEGVGHQARRDLAEAANPQLRPARKHAVAQRHVQRVSKRVHQAQVHRHSDRPAEHHRVEARRRTPTANRH